MTVNSCGINTTHDKYLSINNPRGSGDYMFIFTKTPAIIEYNGSEAKYPAGTSVFFKKGDPQRFRAAGDVYVNDYIHFSVVEAEEEEYIKGLNIPSGKPFFSIDSSVYMEILKQIVSEYTIWGDRREEILDLLMRYFLIKLSFAVSKASSISISSSTRDKMNKLRAEIFNSPGLDWSIPKLAAKINLSESHFQAVYKHMFQKTCIADVIFARVEYAKRLLTSSDKSISEIAELCGYESHSLFARQFKKITGITASQFREISSQKND